MKQLIFFIAVLTVATLHAQPVVTRFDKCADIDGINFDSIYAHMPADLSLSMIILRAEGTHQGSKTISPLGDHLVPYDNSLIHIFSYELRYTSGANSCSFRYAVNGNSDNYTKGIPPFMCLASADTNVMNLLRATLGLVPYQRSGRFLVIGNTYENDSGFYAAVNKILSRYTAGFIFNQLYQNRRVQLQPYQPRRRSISFVTGLGSFAEQLKKANSIPIPANQSYKSLPMLLSFVAFLQQDLHKHFFIRAGLELWIARTGVYSKTISSFPVDPAFSVIRSNPIAHSTACIGGASMRFGYTFSRVRIGGISLPVQVDLGLMGSRILYGSSEAGFSANGAAGSTVQVRNRSFFKDDFSLYVVSSPSISYAMSRRLSLQAGLSGIWGLSVMNPAASYRLLDANGQYHALEAASQYIFLQGITFTCGLRWELE